MGHRKQGRNGPRCSGVRLDVSKKSLPKRRASAQGLVGVVHAIKQDAGGAMEAALTDADVLLEKVNASTIDLDIPSKQ